MPKSPPIQDRAGTGERHRKHVEAPLVLTPALLETFGPEDPRASRPPGVRERVTVLPVRAVPGAELWTAEGSTRLWTSYHAEYAFGCLDDTAPEISWWYQGRQHVMGPGSISMVEPGEVHGALANPSPSGFKMLRIEVGTVATTLGSAELGPPLGQLAGAQTEDPAVRRAFLDLCRSIQQGQDEALGVEEALLRFLARVFRPAHDAVPAPIAGTRCSRALQRTRQMAIERYAERLSLDDFAREAGLSKFHLERAFKKRTGLSIHEFVVHVRVRMAQLRLREGARPSEVATTCGFSDAPHLTRTMRKLSGVSPGEYHRAFHGP